MSLDQVLAFAAATVELGLPAGCLLAWATRPSWRPRLAVLLGAATPWVIIYAAAISAVLARPRSENLFGALAIWEMSFIFYVCNIGIAAALAELPAPRRLAWRAAMGASPGLAVGSIAAVSTFGRW
jgi:hypothetical protein